MPEGVLVADGSTASGRPSMHSTAPFSSHRPRSARVPAPGPGSASGCLVRMQFLALHQVLPLCFDASTPWRDGADNRLSTRMDVHVLHCDLLLALAAVAVERVEQGRIGARKLVRLAQVLAARLECLLSEHRSPVALHGGIVCKPAAEPRSCLQARLSARYRSTRKE